jgi:cell division protein FtsZ
VRTSLFEPSAPANVPVHANGATVDIGGDAVGDVDVPPFMRH